MYIPFLKLTAKGPKKLMVGRLRFSLEKTYFSVILYDSFRESSPQFSPTTYSWCMEGSDFLAWVVGRVQKGFVLYFLDQGRFLYYIYISPQRLF